jgi:Family of unknown function (DUF6353)
MFALTKLIPNAVSLRVGQAVLQGGKASPTILFGVGVVGVVATAVVASRATLRLDDVLEQTRDDLKTAKELHDSDNPKYSDEDYSKDVIYIYTRSSIAVGKLYTPSIALGLITIACLTKSHSILTRRNAGITAAYAALDKGFREYRQRVVDKYGPEEDNYLRYDQSRLLAQNEKGELVRTNAGMVRPGPNGSIYARFFDPMSSKWEKTPGYNKIFLKAQQNYANDLLHARGHVLLNDVYDMLGLERSSAGAVVGWVLGNGDNYIDFGIFSGDTIEARGFVNEWEKSILLDFNVDGIVYDLI